MYLGFDIGGTKIAGGVVTEDGRVLLCRSVPFPHGKGPAAVAALLASMATELSMCPEVQACGSAAEEPLAESIGVALPGSLDPSRETVLHAHNIDFHQVPFRKLLQEHFPGKTISLLNDGDAATLAELLFGVLRGCQTGLLLTLGTGLGGGLVLGGRLFFGGLGHGTEPGHIVLAQGGPACTCGNRGCAETLCSAGWLAEAGRLALVTSVPKNPQDPDGPISPEGPGGPKSQESPEGPLLTGCGGNPAKIDAKLVLDCAKAGDPLSAEIVQRYVEQLSDALTTYINLLDPELIALGGGVGQTGDFLLRPLREAVERKSYFKYHYKIVPASMGNQAGIVGAALWPVINCKGGIYK